MVRCDLALPRTGLKPRFVRPLLGASSPRWVVPWPVLCVVLFQSMAIGPAGASQPGGSAEAAIAFNRDIRPLLADRCFQCHGPSEKDREAGLRLDRRESAVSEADSGEKAIVPGHAGQSELIVRLLASDQDERMPPQDSGKKPLTAGEVDLFRRWINQGAKYQRHWSFAPLVRPEIPAVHNATYSDQPIDRFILARLERRKIAPSPEADRVTLIRRLTLDLTGLPPTQQEVRAFLNDPREAAYEALVDRLLASEHYGERMAMFWLDLVRYADTVGFHGDQTTTYWPYRDYVIDAFNANLPFDQFTREQLAGDLLPHATERQKIAATYNRLGMMTAEGGAQAKEYLTIYAADRVRNVSGTWLGATMGCARCHDHKFDPFTMRDFYSMVAFFADVKEQGVYGYSNVNGIWGEMKWLPTPEQREKLEELSKQITALKKKLDTSTPELVAAQKAWEAKLRDPSAAGSELPPELLKIVRQTPSERTAAQAARLAKHFRQHAPLLKPVRDRLKQREAEQQRLKNSIAKMPITVAGTPRVIRLLPRGNWMDDSGPIMQPAVPAFLAKLDMGDRRPSRLDLANWLTAADNPLTARTLVNRLWKLFFGEGICRSMDDVGAQGEWPSHPELIDWLAVELVHSGWDVRHVIRSIVLTRTYRQSSQPRPELAKIDPENRLLARQARFRLDAELVRDGALSVSGLLVPAVGGPSVKPYQPAGYYAQLNFPTRTYQADVGEKQYRRGLYTHWQRTFLHPMLKAFDAPSRETCTASRPRSNTPLQALTLLNDPTFVEAARALAERILREGGSDDAARIDWAFRQTVAHRPPAEIARTLAELHVKHRTYYRANPAAARQLSEVGDRPVPDGIDLSELAAWTSVARAVLNLHEMITRY